MKSVRVFDVLVLGSLAALYTFQPRHPKWVREALLLTGLGVVAYNARNYLIKRDAALQGP
jgi:hypothetical protein